MTTYHKLNLLFKKINRVRVAASTLGFTLPNPRIGAQRKQAKHTVGHDIATPP